MYDRELVRSILVDVEGALVRIRDRSAPATSPSFFTDSPEGVEKLDGICMLFMAVGEGIKRIDKMSSGELLAKYPAVDWEGVKGFRDIV